MRQLPVVLRLFAKLLFKSYLCAIRIDDAPTFSHLVFGLLMNTVIVGQQHYRWEVRTYTWLQSMECAIFNLVDPLERLYIIAQTTDTDFCTPQQVAIWIDLALRRNWYSNTKVFQYATVGHAPHLFERPYSLFQEAFIVEEIAQKHAEQQTTALQKSNISYQWEQLQQTARWVIPSALQQLYLTLGNGNFGPDHGFFLLQEDPDSPKHTLTEAYLDLQSANIKDLDWSLSPSFLPFMYWESDIYSLIDCSNLYAPVYVLDMNLKKPNTTWQSCCWQHCASFVDWLETWSRDEPSGRSLWLDMYRAKGLI